MQCLFPTKKTPADFKEGTALRGYIILLGLMHILFIVAEIWIYDSFYLALFELVRLWLCYYCYITLGRIPINIYMIYLVVGAGLGIFSVLSTLTGILALVLFPTQLVIMFLAGYKMWFMLG